MAIIGARPRVLSMVLAGGEGKRLMPLTEDRAKPAVPFGGHYRLIDFALSNLANSGFRRIVLLTQYKSHSLDVHVSRTWRMATMLGDYVTAVPAQMRRGARWFLGSADAIYQNLNIIEDEDPDFIFVFGADHLYRMDASQMLDQHIDTDAAVTVAGIRVPIEEASAFGIIEKGATTQINAFREKPEDPVGLPDAPHEVLASMGNYVFTTEALLDLVEADASDPHSRHDVGGNLIPLAVEGGEAHVYDFSDNVVPGSTAAERGYWRDVGTIDAYHDAHMDLVSPVPPFNLYNHEWPIYTLTPMLPPAKLVEDGKHGAGVIADSLLCRGVIVSGAEVRESVLSPSVVVQGGAVVERSIIMDGVVVEEGAVVRNAIIDKNVVVPSKFQVGVEPEADAETFSVSPGGITAIPKGYEL